MAVSVGDALRAVLTGDRAKLHDPHWLAEALAAIESWEKHATPAAKPAAERGKK